MYQVISIPQIAPPLTKVGKNLSGPLKADDFLSLERLLQDLPLTGLQSEFEKKQDC